MRSELAERANGRWRGILSTLGVRSEFLRNRHGPCPKCGGKDRFRWDNKDGDGTFFCSHCGAGNGFTLLMNVKGWDFKQAAKEIEAVVGTVRAEVLKERRSDSECRSAMRARWRSCRKIEPGDPVARYLESRCGVTTFPSVLRSAPERAGMVALMQAPDGRATMIHQTMLTDDGRKAQVPKPRLMMPGTIAKGSAVRLAEYTDTLGIAEGIETAFAASALHGIPTWAALNRVLLAQWQPPEGLRKVVVFGDNDAKFDGQAAAYQIAARLAKAAVDVAVMIPEQAGMDWDDVRREL